MSVASLTGVLVPLILAAMMTAVGLELRPRDFARLARTPGIVLAGLALPPLVLPLVAIALLAAFRPPPEVGVGLLIIAACPVGGIASTFAFLAGASTALSVTLTALSCALSVVSVPALDLVYGRILRQSLGLHVPSGALLAQLAVTVAAPVLVGMAVRRRWPALADRYRNTFRRGAFVLLAALMGLTVAADVRGFVAVLPSCVPVAAAFVVASFVLGAGTGRLVTRDASLRATLAIEFATRNVAVATMIALTVLGRAEYATFATAYFLTELPLMLAAVFVLRVALRTGALSDAVSHSLL